MEGDPAVPTEPETPYVPIRSTAWPQRRIPRWLYLAAAAFLVVAVAVALVHKPTQGEKAADLRGFLTEVTGDIESCAGGVGESLTALRLVQSGTSASATDVSDGFSVAQQGAANCEPATNEEIDNLENYQVPESLYSYKLPGVVTGLISWAAPDAERVQTAVANVLSARTSQARSQAEGQLTTALAALNKQRSEINSVLDAAIKDLNVHESGPRLPG
jgi:hypothetical protein